MPHGNIPVPISDTIGDGAWVALTLLEGEDAWRIEVGAGALGLDVVEVWVTSDASGRASYVGGLGGMPPQGQKLAELTGPNAAFSVQPIDDAGQAAFVNLVRTAGSSTGLNGFVSGTSSS